MTPDSLDGRTPSGRHVIHIGMHKSATTAIQVAAAAARERLSEQGVVYPGNAAHHSDETAFLWTMKRADVASPAAERRWEEFVADVHASGKRAFISAEHLAAATPARIRRLVDDLGADVRIVLTVRNFVSMLPSIWQQYVKERRTVSFDAWLEDVFTGEPGSVTTPNFWPRHDLGELAERWSTIVDPDRITVVVLDREHPDRVYRSFEALLDVPEGTLQPQRINAFQANRGLSLEEVELLRAVNAGLEPHRWPAALYRPAVRGGLIGGLQRVRTPAPEEGTLALPDAWLDTAVEVAARGVREARAAGVRVIGDLDEYARRPAPRGNVPVTTRTASAEVVGVGLAGIAARAVSAGVGFHGVKRDVPARLLASAPHARALDTVPAVAAGASPTLRVLAGADAGAAALAAGVRPAQAHLLAERALHAELARETDRPASRRGGVAPLAAAEDADGGLVAVGWPGSWSGDEVKSALDALDRPVTVTIELPDLPDEISAAWERALVLGGASGFAAWSGWATAPDSWGRWGALPSPAQLADTVELIAGHPQVAGVAVAAAPRMLRRLTGAESAVVAAAERTWHGRRAEASGIAAVMLVGATSGLRRARPFEASSLVIDPSVLARHRKARHAAARRIGSLIPDAAPLLRAWEAQEDAEPHALPAAAGDALAIDHAAEACLGALSVAMGRGRRFDPGVELGWLGDARAKDAATVALTLGARG
ncbi:hypothetical protein [Demequina silvatica]|uniref:hypothetical protein n=1 Tax=Demequina silvatica TaxID=1638988 RepID=UPI000782CF4C|nr:hypothetical protein [Demequina silvatica]